MSAQPARHLHVVDADTGEKLDGCPTCAQKDDEIAGLERALKAEIRRFENLKRDKEAEAKASELWPIGVEVFRCWRRLSGEAHGMGKARPVAFTADRFFLVEPYLKRKGYGPEICVRAVCGITFDCFSVKRKNGTTRFFDEWERCFQDAKQVEERASSAPRDWREVPAVSEALESIRGFQQAREPRRAPLNAQRPAG